MSGWIGDLSEAQQKALDSLRALVPLEQPHSQDEDLLRFLRARNFDVNAAHKQLSACQRWRRENDVDNILNGPYPLEDYLKHTLSFCYYGEDKDGRPLYVERSGMVDAKTMMSVNVDELVRRHVYHQELMVRRTKENAERLGKPLDNWCEIHDMRGLNIQHRQVLGLFQKVARIDSDYYPERAGRIFFVNVPFVFPILWKICRIMLDPKTREKFVVLSDSQLHQLHDYFGPDQLPVEYGGTVKDLMPHIDADRNGPADSVPVTEPALSEKRLPSRSRFVRRYSCTGDGQVVAWYFRLDAPGVKFSVLWSEGSEVAVPDDRDGLDSNSKLVTAALKQASELQRPFRVTDAQDHVAGSHVVNEHGTIWLVWENEALFHAKVLLYNVSVASIRARASDTVIPTIEETPADNDDEEPKRHGEVANREDLPVAASPYDTDFMEYVHDLPPHS